MAQRDLRVGRERAERQLVAARRFLEERPGDQHGVMVAFPQRRDADHGHREPLVEVLPELARPRRGLEVAAGRGDHLDVDATLRGRTDPSDGLLLDHLQELRLERGGDVPDLVEQDGAAVRRLEQARPRRLGVGERALLVAEELRLDQVLGQRGAVHLDEGSLAPSSAGVQRARDVSLAAARFPEQEDGGCRRTGRAGHAHHPLDHAAQPVDRRGLAEDIARHRLPLAMIRNLAALPRAAERAVDAQP